MLDNISDENGKLELDKLLIELADINPPDSHTGDIYSESSQFFYGLFAILYHPQASSKALNTPLFFNICSSLLDMASSLSYMNYKSLYSRTSLDRETVLSNCAAAVLRIYSISPKLLEDSLQAYKTTKSFNNRVLKALNQHEATLDADLKLLITAFEQGKNSPLHLNLPKSRKEYVTEKLRDIHDPFADYLVGSEGIPQLTLKAMTLAHAYVENCLANDLANNPVAAKLFKDATSKPSSMMKATQWLSEQAHKKASDFNLHAVSVEVQGHYPVSIMTLRDESFQQFRQDLDCPHLDYALLNEKSGHLQLGFATTQCHFDNYFQGMNTCFNSLNNALKLERPEFSNIESIGIVLHHINIRQIKEVANVLKEIKVQSTEVNLSCIDEYPAMCFSLALLASNAPSLYESFYKMIEFRPVGKSARKFEQAITLLAYKEQLERAAESLCQFSEILFLMTQQLQVHDAKSKILIDFIIQNFGIISKAIVNIHVAISLSECTKRSEIINASSNKILGNLKLIKSQIIVGNLTSSKLPSLPYSTLEQISEEADYLKLQAKQAYEAITSLCGK